MHIRHLCLLATLTIALHGCKTQNIENIPFNSAMQTYSNFDSVTCKHLNWKANIDFDKKIIHGNATWTFDNKTKSKEIRFDTRTLQINKVAVNGREEKPSFSNEDKDFGTGMLIHLQENDSIISIDYETSPNATAIQWLEPSQTAGKKLPYLFTQCESIHARSLLPCQDVPAIRITYSAEVQTPSGMMAVMSAKNPQQKNADGKYAFKMEIPVPSYLIALAVGDIEYKAINERSGVYTEPSMLEKATTELSEIPAMMKAAEELGGPYRWGNYDVLIAPPSFPIGGMENPRLTFATPTIIAGDKSLTSLIAHEMAHSWSGNLVTNATWNDLWLNEGFTTYFERRIMEKISGKSYNDMLWELGYQDMMMDINDSNLSRDDTKLRIELNGRHPEDAFTNIPYEKGAVFLRLIEENVGRANFDAFLNKYFQSNAFTPMTTEKCLHLMDEYLFKGKEQLKQKINVQDWVYGKGLLPNCPHQFPQRFLNVNSIVKNTNEGHIPTKDQTKEWTTHEWLHYLRGLPRTINVDKLVALDKEFNLTRSTNSEISAEWFRLGIAAGYDAILSPLDSFLSTVGRKKFLTPLYSDLKESKKFGGLAKEIFSKYKMNYHPQTAKKMEEVLAITDVKE